MECNKDEAIRAMEIAEQKMQNKDFVGAQKLLRRAKQLYPNLENISLMLIVCDVHCSTEHKALGSDKDWYGILQIEQTADDASIKNQFRKLARRLHPDKNKFPGAESAFSVVGEAKRCLLDSEKRSIYDMKYSSFTRFYERKQQHQTQTRFSNGRQTFWTSCPVCNIRYQYYRDIVNRILRCQRCLTPFIAFELDTQESLPIGNDKGQQSKNNRKEAAAQKHNKEDDKAVSLKAKTEAEFFEVPDSDFNDFDMDRKEGCFAVGQTWAMYDDIDGMPRFYARIRKIYSHGFKVQITWLDPHPDDQDAIDWTTERLPVACGKFRQNNTEDIEHLGMFSHRVDWEKGTTRGSCWIYPRKGETWALFKNWHIEWSSDPDNHRNYQYEFVQVLSDYTKESGVDVAFLVKIKGFTSLFKLTINNRMVSFQIPPNELLRFSHRVPSFRTTGRERVDVPEGYFELDPASLPGNIEEITEPLCSMKENVNRSHAEFSVSSKSPAEERPHTPKKRKNYDENNTADGGNSSTGNQSPRLADGSYKKKRSEDCAGYPVDKNHSSSDGVNVYTGRVDEQSSSAPSHVDPIEIPNAEFFNFAEDKSPEKFKHGQIWALYCDLDALPKFYGQIKMVALSPNFRLEIKWLEPCDPSMGVIQWRDKKIPICCGTFTSGETAVLDDTDSFSHLLTGVTAGKENKYEIYPRKGEVWALYRYFNYELSCSDLLKCEFDMVEVVEESDEKIKVLLLSKLQGFKTVFKGKIIAGHEFFMQISRAELLRFSHQVPAFKLANERDCKLRGCWELDPEAMPVCLFSSETHDVSTFGRASAFTCQADAKEIVQDGMNANPDIVAKKIPSFHLNPCEIRNAKFYNFEDDKTREKFKPGQIWALYCHLDGMPKYYVHISRVELIPDFKLHVKYLKACRSKEVLQWLDKKIPICCGTFSSGKSGVFNDTASFSHQSRVEPTDNSNKYEIHPRKGEVWALYRNCSSRWSYYDLHKCNYDMVEVLEDHGFWIVVSVLRQVAGYETVFKAKRKAGRKFIIGVARFELFRFSHQVPAFQLTDERDGSLRGYWELDRKSIPVRLLSC